MQRANDVRAHSNLVQERGGGVLIVEPSPNLRQRLPLQLQQLDVEVHALASAEAAIEHIAEGAVPGVVIVNLELPGMDGGEFCQWLRSNAHTATAYILVLADADDGSAARLLNRGADDFVNTPYEARLLRARVRSGLRAQAFRRFLSRKSRLDAMTWLGVVVAHEINNPLAAALANVECLRSMIGELAETRDNDELRAVVDDTMSCLDRMRGFTSSLQRNTGGEGSDSELITTAQVREQFDVALGSFEGNLKLEIDAEPDWQGYVNLELLVGMSVAILKRAHARCDGNLSMLVHLEPSLVALLIDLGGAPNVDPESILEPCLVDDGKNPPYFDPRLSPIESQFIRSGGQVFARSRSGRWRFGLKIPVHRQGNADNEAA